MSEQLTVFLIEDNPADARLLRIMLAGEGDYIVEWAATWVEAVSILANTDYEPDVILLDLILPDAPQEPLAPLSVITDLAPNSAVLIHSGLYTRELAKQAVDLGASSYMLKGERTPDGLDSRIRVAYYRKRMLSMQEDRRQIISRLSHEVRTPLTSVYSTLELMLEAWDEVSPEYLHNLANRALRGATALKVLVENIALAEQNGRNHTVFDLAAVAAGICDKYDKYQNMSGGRGIVVSQQLAGVQVEGNEDAIAGILDALVNNAVKFSPDNGEVVVQVTQIGESAVVHVTDNGPGISENLQNRIFEWGYQTEPLMTRLHGGMGIGLSIARAVARLHHGSLIVASQPGHGSTFTLTLPQNLS